MTQSKKAFWKLLILEGWSYASSITYSGLFPQSVLSNDTENKDSVLKYNYSFI